MNRLCMCDNHIKAGKVKFTNNQIKKHYSQINNEEFEYIENILKNMKRLYLTNHLKNKIIWNAIDFADIDICEYILDKLNEDNLSRFIIEFNRVEDKRLGNSNRVLLRFDDNVYVLNKNNNRLKCNICVVLNLNTNQIITAYFNKANDYHVNINMNRYDEKLDVIKSIHIY